MSGICSWVGGFKIFKLLPVATSKSKVENIKTSIPSINAMKHSLVRSKLVKMMAIKLKERPVCCFVNYYL